VPAILAACVRRAVAQHLSIVRRPLGCGMIITRRQLRGRSRAAGGSRTRASLGIFHKAAHGGVVRVRISVSAPSALRASTDRRKVTRPIDVFTTVLALGLLRAGRGRTPRSSRPTAARRLRTRR